MSRAATQVWRLEGPYRSIRVLGTVAAATRALINLVNLQGAGRVVVKPSASRAKLATELDVADPASTWRDWWHRASGQPVVLSEANVDRRESPHHAMVRDLEAAGRSLGVNVGGSYLRLVWLVDGRAEANTELRLDRCHHSDLRQGSVSDFVDLLELSARSRDVRRIGVAWSAARTALGLRAGSAQAEHAGELGALLDRGQLDDVLTELCGCPVSSWTDGEAIAAAEVLGRSEPLDRPLLVLKLGTSLAAGLATREGVSGLPLQVAKCVLTARPACPYRHPFVGLRGTARGLLGADSIVRCYREASRHTIASYRDFCMAALRSDENATRIVRAASAALVEVAGLVSDAWTPVTLVVTGKNVENREFRELLQRRTRARGICVRPEIIVGDPACDVNLVAAIGAVALTVANA